MENTEAQSLSSNASLLPVIILVEGFVSIAIEILTIRQLLPVAGGSVIVTSLIIGIFLLFLALGYHRGGQIKADLQKRLRTNFFIAAIWLGLGLSYIFIGFFFHLTQKLTGPHVVYPLVMYLMLVTAPLIYILGQTLPITMNMVKQKLSAGTIGGNALGVSTIGSFLGAITTTLILMYYLGVAYTVLINSILLIALNLLLVERSSFLSQLCLSALATGVIYVTNISIENSYFVLTDNYANYQIYDEHNSKMLKGEKIFIINDGLSSFINIERKGFPYVETIKKILFLDMQLHHANILVLGAGGFSLSAEYTNDNSFTYVDIDPQIKKAAIPKFIDKLKSTFIADDARHFLQTTEKYYNVIISDAYSDIKSIPAHLLTREYIQSIQKRLTADGTAIFNIIAKPTLSDPYSKRIDNTLRSVFQNCMVMPFAYANKATNILYVCSNSKNQMDRKIYSDNLNNSTTDSFAW